MNSIKNSSTHKFNKQFPNTLLREGWDRSTHELIGRAVDNLSPGGSGDHKSRIVLGLVAWENAKGKRVCQQRLRDTRKSVRAALNRFLKAKQPLLAPAEFCLPQVLSPATLKNAPAFMAIKECYRDATGSAFPPIHYVVLGLVEYEEVVTVSLLRPKRTYYLCVVRETYLLFVLSRRTLV